MSEEQGFLRHLQENPDDDTTRRIYADWLTDRDDRRGEYLRLEVELACLRKEEPASGGIEARLRELRPGLDGEWIARAGKRFDVVLRGYGPGKKIATIRALRELRSLGSYEVQCFSEILPLCVGVAQERAVAEQWRDRLLDMVRDLIVEVAPTVFRQPIYAVILTARRRWDYPQPAFIQQILIEMLQIDAREVEQISKPGVLRAGLTLPEAQALLARANINPLRYFELRRGGS